MSEGACRLKDINPIFYPVDKRTIEMEIFRNFYCPCYEKCLNQAFKDDTYLYCGECSYKDTKNTEGWGIPNEQ